MLTEISVTIGMVIIIWAWKGVSLHREPKKLARLTDNG